MTRFKIASSKLGHIETLLSAMKYTELTPSVDVDSTEPRRILINKKTKIFYYLDAEAEKHARQLIEEFLKQTLKTVTLKKIQKWERLQQQA
jgi:hypothetical protein